MGRMVKKLVDYEIPEDEEMVFKIIYNCMNCNATFSEEYGKDIVVGYFFVECHVCGLKGAAHPTKREPLDENYISSETPNPTIQPTPQIGKYL